MGDRCWLMMEVHEDDRQQLIDEFGEGVFEPLTKEKIRTYEYEDVNYGAWDEIHALAEANLTFVGYHTAGTEYGAYAFASFGGEIAQVTCDNDGDPVAYVEWNGVTVNIDPLEAVTFYQIEQKARGSWKE